jgi:hypothetical protein
MKRSSRSLVNWMIVTAVILFGSQAIFFYANSAATVRHLVELNDAGPRQAIREQTGRASHTTRGPRGNDGVIQLRSPSSGPIEIACPRASGAEADPCSPLARRDWTGDDVTITWIDLRLGLSETLVHRPLRIVAGARTLFETSLDETLATEWRGARRSMWVMPAFDVLMAGFLVVMLAWRNKTGQGGAASRDPFRQARP